MSRFYPPNRSFSILTQVKQLEGEGAKKTVEVAELQERVKRDEGKEEENRKETFGLKQKVIAMTVQ